MPVNLAQDALDLRGVVVDILQNQSMLEGMIQKKREAAFSEGVKMIK